MVTLYLSATDNDGAVPQMQLSMDNMNWSAWERYVTRKVVALLPGTGERSIYVRFRDRQGNLSPVYSDSITVLAIRRR
jgi:hypothetical protein